MKRSKAPLSIHEGKLKFGSCALECSGKMNDVQVFILRGCVLSLATKGTTSVTVITSFLISRTLQREPACMSEHHVCAVPAETRRASDSLKLGLQMMVSCYVGGRELSPGPLED